MGNYYNNVKFLVPAFGPLHYPQSITFYEDSTLKHVFKMAPYHLVNLEAKIELRRSTD